MKKNRWVRNRRMVWILAVMLLLIVSVAALWQKQREEEPQETMSESQAEILEPEEEEPEAAVDKEPGGVDKEETVYVKAGADGQVKEITVENVLRGENGSDTIRDFSTLQDIRNTKGDEEFTKEADGTLLWQNHGETIYYKGTSDQELPVSVKISYYLDGSQVRPEEIAGQSGSVRIRFDYENHAWEPVTVEEEQTDVPVPFTVFSAVVLPSDVFSNIEVENGKVISMEDQNMVLGYACPGVADYLRLEEYELTEEITIPEYVEITADARDFELAFTATIVSPGLFSDLDENDLNDVDDLVEDMKKLTDASTELVDGTEELYDGVKEFQSYMQEYANGADALNDGGETLQEGLKTLNTQKEQLAQGAAALQNGLERVNDALEGVSFSDFKSEGSASAGTAIKALMEDAGALTETLTALQGALSEIQAFVGEAAAYGANVERAEEEAKSELEAAKNELAEVDKNATEMARSQAESAVDAALADVELSAQQKAEIKDKITGNMNLTGLATGAQSHIDGALGKLGSVSGLTIPEHLNIDTGSVTAVISDMEKQLTVLSAFAQNLSQMGETMTEMEDSLAALKSGIGQLRTGSQQLTEGITAFNQGIEMLYQGSVQLSGGTATFSSAGHELSSGFGALVDGVQALKEGVTEFDEEGIQGLGDLAGEDLKAITARIKALKEADGQYENFAGIADGKTGSVKFVIETEELEKP